MSKPVPSIYQWRHTKTDMTQPSLKALADLERRNAMPDTRDNTGRLLGDPPPGRSALDRKRAAANPQPHINPFEEQEHADD